MITVELFIVSTAGVQTTLLSDCESITLSPIFSDTGTFSFTYPHDGASFAYLKSEIDADRKVEVAVKIDGVTYDSMRWLVETYEGDDASDDENVAVWTFSGRGEVARFEDGIVWTTSSTQSVTYTTMTPGQIMIAIIANAVTRGCYADMSYNFTVTNDSAGVAWGTTYTLTFSAGMTHLQVLQQLYASGYAEFSMNGRVLQMYKYGTIGTHLDGAGTDVRFIHGRDLTDSPRQRDITGVTTSILATGENGVFVNQSDAPALARVGRRRESYVSTGNVGDTTTLGIYGTNVLQQNTTGKYQKTIGVDFTLAGTPAPFSVFNVGDWVPIEGPQMLNGREVLRVKQIALTYNDSGITGSVVFNDLAQELDDALALKVTAIENGTTVTGASQGTTSGTGVDGIAPGQVLGVSVVSTAYITPTGVLLSALIISYAAIAVNTDGTVMNDLNAYHVQWQYATGITTWHEVVTLDTVIGINGITPNVGVNVRVRGIDQAGNIGAWSATVSATTATDVTAPNTPSLPTVVSGFGILTIGWNGLDSGAAAMPTDFDHINILISTVNNFALTDPHSTIVLYGQGAYTWSGGTIGTTYYVKFNAVDHAGNTSALSAQATGLPRSVINSDLANSIINTANLVNGAVGNAQLATLAVGTANIQALAVTDALIGSVSAAKITVGTLSADIVLGARIMTASTGARVELNASGMYAYDSSSNQTIAISSTGSVTVAGTVRTGPATGQYMTMGPSLSGGRPGLAGYSAIAAETAPAILALGNGTPSGGIATSTATFSAGTMSTQPAGSVGAGLNAYAGTTSQASIVNLHADSLQLRAASSTMTLGAHTINFTDSATSAPFVFTSDVGVQFTGTFNVVGAANFSGGNVQVAGLLNPAGDSYRVVHGTIATATTSATGGITVSHGLSVTPTSVVCVSANNTTGSQVFSVFSITSTQFSVRVTSATNAGAAVASASVSFYWMAAI